MRNDTGVYILIAAIMICAAILASRPTPTPAPAAAPTFDFASQCEVNGGTVYYTGQPGSGYLCDIP